MRAKLDILALGAGELEEDVFEAGADGSDLGGVEAVVGEEAVDFAALLAGRRRWPTRRLRGGRGQTTGTLRSAASASASSRQADAQLAALAEEACRRALGDDAAGLEDRDGVADLLDFVEEMAAENDGAAFGGELGDEFADLARALGVEAVGRLVEDDRARDRGGWRRRCRGAASCRGSTS